MLSFDQFKSSKLLYELMWKLSMPYSRALFRRAMMSSMGDCLPRPIYPRF